MSDKEQLNQDRSSGKRQRRLTTRHILITFVLSIPLLVLISSDDDSSEQNIVKVNINRDVDYFIDQATAIQFDAKGRLDQTLMVEKLSHFPNKEYALLTSPRLFRTEENGAQLSVKSESGILFDADDRIDLNNQVKAERISPEKVSSTLETETLTLNQATQIIETDAPVTVLSQGSSSHSTGIQVDLNSGITQLKSKVKGTYYVDNASQ